MRQLRFIFIAFLTSLSVTNATLLRKTLAVLLFSILSFDSIGFYGFVNQGGKADAVTPKGNTKGQAAASQSNDSIAGKWSSDWGPVEFNSNLTGQWNQGVGIGQIKDGTYDPKTRKLVFHYYQPWNDMDGTVTLTLSEDGGQLSGVWTQQRGSSPIGSGGSGGWTMKRATPVTTDIKTSQCHRFQTMLTEAEDIQKLADTLETDDKAYNAAVIDIVLRGYSSPYAVYMLDVPPEEIPELFKDNQQIRAVRSQIISRIRTKASNRKRFADIGINGQFIPATPIYSKENIELFCTLDSSKFTKEFWDSLWMTGYIDYNLYTQVENQLIVFGYKGYFEKLDYAATLLTLPVGGLFQFGRYALETGFTKLFLTKLEVGVTKQLASKNLPKVAVEELGSASSSINALRLRNQLAAKQIVDGHAFEKHVIQEKEFSGITTRQQFQEYLERIMNSSETLVKNLSSGRTGFYDKISNTVIIYTPQAIDKGTAFRPKEGINYFLELK